MSASRHYLQAGCCARSPTSARTNAAKSSRRGSADGIDQRARTVKAQARQAMAMPLQGSGDYHADWDQLVGRARFAGRTGPAWRRSPPVAIPCRRHPSRRLPPRATTAAGAVSSRAGPRTVSGCGTSNWLPTRNCCASTPGPRWSSGARMLTGARRIMTRRNGAQRWCPPAWLPPQSWRRRSTAWAALSIRSRRRWLATRSNIR
jgi:hypothetical protein